MIPPKMDGDRAMCRDHECESSQDCLRFMARPAKFQVYADMCREPDAERCDSFIPFGSDEGDPD